MNADEGRVHDYFVRHGYTVLRGGWPDFLCVSENHVLFVEVKSVASPALLESQKTMLAVLAAMGLPVVVWRKNEFTPIPHDAFARLPTPIGAAQNAWRRKLAAQIIPDHPTITGT